MKCYLSKDIQNEILGLMTEHILKEISSNIQQSTFHCLMADETTYAANRGQLVIVTIG